MDTGGILPAQPAAPSLSPTHLYLGRLGELPEFGEAIRQALLRREAIGKVRENAPRHADVLELQADGRRLREGLDDGEEAVRGEHRGFVRVRVHNLGPCGL